MIGEADRRQIRRTRRLRRRRGRGAVAPDPVLTSFRRPGGRRARPLRSPACSPGTRKRGTASATSSVSTLATAVARYATTTRGWCRSAGPAPVSHVGGQDREADRGSDRAAERLRRPGHAGADGLQALRDGGDDQCGNRREHERLRDAQQQEAADDLRLGVVHQRKAETADDLEDEADDNRASWHRSDGSGAAARSRRRRSPPRRER